MNAIARLAEKNLAASMKSRDGSVVPYQIELYQRAGRTDLCYHVAIPEELAEDFIVTFMKSFEIDGVNGHVSEALGYIPYPNKVVFRDNKKNAVVWEWVAPMFFVW